MDNDTSEKFRIIESAPEPDLKQGELLFSIRKISSGRYLAVREESPRFALEGKTITEVTEKAIKVFLWKDEDAS